MDGSISTHRCHLQKLRYVNQISTYIFKTILAIQTFYTIHIHSRTDKERDDTIEKGHEQYFSIHTPALSSPDQRVRQTERWCHWKSCKQNGPGVRGVMKPCMGRSITNLVMVRRSAWETSLLLHQRGHSSDWQMHIDIRQNINEGTEIFLQDRVSGMNTQWKG